MPENPHHGSDRLGKEVDRRVLLPVSPADDKDNGAAVINLWSHDETLASAERELDAPVVDVGAAMRGDCAGIRRAAEQVSGACSSHGLFQVTGHGLDPTLARAALDGAADFFRLPLATKQRASRAPGNVTGYTTAHADRFTANLPWKETLSFGHRDRGTSGSDVVVDYFTSTLGSDFKPLG
jgi:hypothetical protein